MISSQRSKLLEKENVIRIHAHNEIQGLVSLPTQGHQKMFVGKRQMFLYFIKTVPVCAWNQLSEPRQLRLLAIRHRYVHNIKTCGLNHSLLSP